MTERREPRSSQRLPHELRAASYVCQAFSNLVCAVFCLSPTRPSRFILGGRNPSAAVFNGAARAAAFPPPRLQAWLAHCVEEFGNFPYFLPAVYDTQAAMVTLKAG